jgi:hypothetical protein
MRELARIGADGRACRCNDKENDRMGYDSVVSERALREVYLMPFMLAQKLAKPWAVMSSCVFVVLSFCAGALSLAKV